MTNHSELLDDTALEIVAGGVTTFVGNSIPKPNIPRDKDLLTPAMIEKVLNSFNGFIPRIPRS